MPWWLPLLLAPSAPRSPIHAPALLRQLPLPPLIQLVAAVGEVPVVRRRQLVADRVRRRIHALGCRLARPAGHLLLQHRPGAVLCVVVCAPAAPGRPQHVLRAAWAGQLAKAGKLAEGACTASLLAATAAVAGAAAAQPTCMDSRTPPSPSAGSGRCWPGPLASRRRAAAAQGLPPPTARRSHAAAQVASIALLSLII